MRRKDREVKDIEKIADIIKKCDKLVLSLNDTSLGYPYIFPVNFGYDISDGKILFYFHSALEGKKLDLMKKDDRASFEMDTSHELIYLEDKGYCTMNYESVVGRGRIRIIEDEKEKIKALKFLMSQYHDSEDKYFNPKAIPRTLVYKLEVEEITGKIKK